MPASIYLRDREILAHALHRTVDGALVPGLPALRLAREATPSEIGRALRAILSQTAAVIAHPADWTGVDAPVLAAFGARSWGSISRTARLCTLSEDEQWLEIVPMRNGGGAGRDRGFHELPARATRISRDVTDHDLGESVLRAETQCE